MAHFYPRNYFRFDEPLEIYTNNIKNIDINYRRYYKRHHKTHFRRKLDNYYYEIKDYCSAFYKYTDKIVHYQEKLGNYEESMHEFIRNIQNLHLSELDKFFSNIESIDNKIQEYVDVIDEYYEIMKTNKKKIQEFREISYDYELTKADQEAVERIMQVARSNEEKCRVYYHEVNNLAADDVRNIKIEYIKMQCTIQKIRYQF